MRYGIVGSRSFTDYAKLCDVLKPQVGYITQIISGGARGADTLGKNFAMEHNIPLTEFFPNYDKFRKKAPFVRNKEIVKNSDIIYAFWDGKSPGTAHTLDYAEKCGVKSIVILF